MNYANPKFTIWDPFNSTNNIVANSYMINKILGDLKSNHNELKILEKKLENDISQKNCEEIYYLDQYKEFNFIEKILCGKLPSEIL